MSRSPGADSSAAPPAQTAGRILVGDVEPIFRAGLRGILTEAGYEVEQTAALDCVPRVARGDVTGIVLDARLGPSDYALDLVHAVRAADPQLGVTVVIGSPRGPGLVPLLEAGVGALLHRTCTPEELVAAVRASLSGHNWVGGPLAGLLQQELLADTPGVGHEPLTPREREVLALLATGGTNLGIGHRLGISEHTVRNHVRAIMAKLGVANRTDAVATAARKGLVDLDRPVR